MKRQRGTITPAKYDGGSRYCGPTSLSAITGHPTSKITRRIRQMTNRTAIKGMFNYEVLEYLRQSGYTVEEVYRSLAGKNWPARFITPTRGPAITLRRFIEYHQRGRDVYLVNVTGHYLVLFGSEVVCTSAAGQPRPALESKYLRCKVKYAWRVT